MLAQLEDIRREISGTTTCGQIDGTTHGTPGTAKKLIADATWCRKAIVRTPKTGNAADVNIGPTNAATYKELAAGGDEYTIEAPLGKRFDLATWYSKSTSATQTYRVLYFA